MTIPVTCPACMKRFNVSDQFAGRTGPCPNCQKPINIPEKSEEVVIHAPEDAGPKDSAGKLVLKPLRRKEVSLGLPVILGAIAGTIAIFAIAFGLGLSGQQPQTAVLAIGALLLAPPLVFIGYWFLHDDELEGFKGRALLIRSAICSIAFAVSWALYAYVPRYVSGHASMAELSGPEMLIFCAIMIALGTAVSVAAMELEIVQGVLHYMFYFAITFALAWLAGTHLSNPLSDGPDPGKTRPPAVVSPGEPASPPLQRPPTEKTVPKLLQ